MLKGTFNSHAPDFNNYLKVLSPSPTNFPFSSYFFLSISSHLLLPSLTSLSPSGPPSTSKSMLEARLTSMKRKS